MRKSCSMRCLRTSAWSQFGAAMVENSWHLGADALSLRTGGSAHVVDSAQHSAPAATWPCSCFYAAANGGLAKCERLIRQNRLATNLATRVEKTRPYERGFAHYQ